jgi:hypothetical protein
MSSSNEILIALRRLEDNLSERLDRRFDEFRLEMNARFDAIETRLERLETEYPMITSRIAPGP